MCFCSFQCGAYMDGAVCVRLSQGNVTSGVTLPDLTNPLPLHQREIRQETPTVEITSFPKNFSRAFTS